MEQRNVAIVQARMGSSRFPGKMLAHLNGMCLLEWVLSRLSMANSLNQIVVATSMQEDNDSVCNLALSLGVKVWRGEELNVLSRFVHSANTFEADNVVRVCADNPFVDPIEVDRLVHHFINCDCDYACNHQDKLGSGYADGFGAEIFSRGTLEIMALNAESCDQKEHVTKYLWDNAEQFLIHSISAPKMLAYPELRFDVDTPTDLAKLETLSKKGVRIDTKAPNIIALARHLQAETHFHSFASLSSRDEIEHYLQLLFPICRSITGDGNRTTLAVLDSIMPISIHEVPTGTVVYDWVVPDEWQIRDAWIADKVGNRLVDFNDNNLHLVGYSCPINKTMKWSELMPRLHKHDSLQNAIPYRTSYYNKDWGFCVTDEQYKKIQLQKHPVTVVINTELKPGSLTYGEILIRGTSSREILISCYICHPSMANDSLSGVLVTSMLARYIKRIKDLHWTYRIVFVPETIGAVAYCALNESAMKNIDFGLVITTVGGGGKFGYKQSWDASHHINRIVEEVFRSSKIDFEKYPFDIHGSDERQYSSPGFRINCVTICKDKYYEYPEYHSSQDNLEFVNSSNIEATFDVYCKLIDEFERLVIYRRAEPHGETMLSKHNLYSTLGGAKLPTGNSVDLGDIFLWVLFHTDGNKTVEDISSNLDLPKQVVDRVYEKLLQTGIVELV